MFPNDFNNSGGIIYCSDKIKFKSKFINERIYKGFII